MSADRGRNDINTPRIKGGENLKKNLRILLFLIILMFLLIPLFSGNVSAAVPFLVSVDTNNTPGGPYVGLHSGCPTPCTQYNPIPLTCDGSGILTISCDAYIEDTNPSGSGSDHYVELNVQRVWPTTGPLLATNTGLITLAANTRNSPYPQRLTISTSYTVGEDTLEIFHVYVYAECEDLSTSIKVWNTWSWYVSI